MLRCSTVDGGVKQITCVADCNSKIQLHGMSLQLPALRCMFCLSTT